MVPKITQRKQLDCWYNDQCKEKIEEKMVRLGLNEYKKKGDEESKGRFCNYKYECEHFFRNTKAEMTR
jgi:hypothetical protein